MIQSTNYMRAGQLFPPVRALFPSRRCAFQDRRVPNRRGQRNYERSNAMDHADGIGGWQAARGSLDQTCMT
jgi:hypothetical protein